MSRSFRAQYGFTCGRCGEWHNAGTLAHYDDFTHILVGDEDCDDDPNVSGANPGGSIKRGVEVMPQGKMAKDRCDRCFIVHSAGQEDCY